MPSLLITLGAPLYQWQGKLWLERQAIEGHKAWAEHFDRLISFARCLDREPPADCSPIDENGLLAPAFEVIALPDGYHLPTYLRTRKAVAAQMLDAMRRVDFVSCAIGGWIGDWGVVAADVAARHGIAHAVWFDRVESQVQDASGGNPLKARIRSAVAAHNERKTLRRAQLALLHGRTVFDALGGLSRNPMLVEDVHIEARDRLSPEGLRAKRDGAGDGPLRIVYAGRAERMKGGLDWIETLGLLHREGVEFTAAWAGDGALLDAMRARADELGLAGRVVFHGFVADRDRLLELLREGHLLMFCHLTDESPRVLIEALHAATPLAGFRDAFAADLVAEQGAGLLVARGDRAALAQAVAGLARDRTRLRDLIDRAARSARHLTRAQVFADRSAIIKQTLAAPNAEVA